MDFPFGGYASTGIQHQIERLDSGFIGRCLLKSLAKWQTDKGNQACKKVRQGDPISPLLFILAIDPLQCIIEVATERDLLKTVLSKTAKLRCSLYADDAAIFSDPSVTDLDQLLKILTFFGECSGLKINISKTERNFQFDVTTWQSLSFYKSFLAKLQISGQILRAPPPYSKTTKD